MKHVRNEIGFFSTSRTLHSFWHLNQGPRSNFEMGAAGAGGGTISDSILGRHKTLFLTNSL